MQPRGAATTVATMHAAKPKRAASPSGAATLASKVLYRRGNASHFILFHKFNPNFQSSKKETTETH
jgi:hypothetical protein